MTHRAQQLQWWHVVLLFLSWCAASQAFTTRGVYKSQTSFISSKSTILFSFHSVSHFDSALAKLSSTTLPWKNSACSLFQKKSFLCMGKGDGKKRRKKKSATTLSTPQQQQPQQPLPQRVSTDINIPIRRQIRYAQMHKEAAKQSGASFRQKKVARTKYRRTWGKHLLYNLFASVSVCAFDSSILSSLSYYHTP
jgi:hypothetical protein